MLQRKKGILKVAVLTDDSDVTLGWSLSEPETLHYIFVASDYRKTGIGRSLLPKDIKNITHLTQIGLKIWNKLFKDAIFNPFL